MWPGNSFKKFRLFWFSESARKRKLQLLIGCCQTSFSKIDNSKRIMPFRCFSLGRKRRSASIDLDEKVAVLQNLEAYLPTLMRLPAGSNSHECILRAICEVARTPSTDDGLLGVFINTLLTPWHEEPMNFQGNSDYVDAQQRGLLTQDCSPYHHLCQLSFFQVTTGCLKFFCIFKQYPYLGNGSCKNDTFLGIYYVQNISHFYPILLIIQLSH